MKRILRALLAAAAALACLLVFSAALAGALKEDAARTGTLEEDIAEYKSAETVDGQLSILSRLAEDHADEIETGGWISGLRVQIAADLPAGLIPGNYEEYGYTKADTFPKETRGHKFIAIYLERNGSKTELAGDWLARFPREMRAASLAEAEYALVAEGWWTPSGYRYIPAGSSSHRDYAAYVLDLKTGAARRFWSHRNGAKTSGTIGNLSGDNMSASDMWYSLRSSVWGTMRYELGSGTALLFSATGKYCYLKGYEGEPAAVEIPSQVEGYTVNTLWRNCFSGCGTLTGVVLPDTVKEIYSNAFKGCSALESVVLPDGLEAIYNAAFRDCSRLRDIRLPAGLKTLSSEAFYSASALTGVTVPGSVEKLPSSLFRYCSKLSRVVVEEGVASLGDDDFGNCPNLAFIYLPASVSRATGLESISAGAVIYAPEGSYALKWAKDNGREAVACASPDGMPAVEYLTEGDFEFRVIGGDAMLSAYLGEDAEITVPETVSGLEVAGLLHRSLVACGTLEKVTLPESIRTIAYRAIESAKDKYDFHVYIGNPECEIEAEGIRPYPNNSAYTVTVHAPEGSSAQRYVTDTDNADIRFETWGEGVDPASRTLRDALTLARGVQHSVIVFWQTCDQAEYSLLSAVPDYDISKPQGVVLLRVTEGSLTDPTLQMAGPQNAVKMYATLSNSQTDMAYARAATRTARNAQLKPAADGVSAVAVLSYGDDWILVSLMQDGNAQAILYRPDPAAGELTAGYIADIAARNGVTGECVFYSTAEFSAIAK